MITKGWTWVLPLLLAAVGCAYLTTSCPVVYLGDSGELTAAAFCLGVPHATGYPVHALLGKVFCFIPIGNVGFRMNLMSAVFGVLTVWVVYSLIYRMTASKAGAFAGAGTLAFIRIFWWQTVAAEVYTLHAFFVAVMLWLLWKWDESREFHFLVVFALVTGLSFGNHMQTVMLGPAVFYLILTGEWRALLKWKRFLALSIFFVLALLVYVYLPVRTWADAAIHWGDPDSWDRFWTHVSGRAHRRGYIFNLSLTGYADRAEESLWLIWKQFGVMVLVGMWGWWKVRSWRWRVFFVMVVVFDYVYTIGLNTVSLEITPFNLATCIIMAVLIGVGVAEGVKECERHAAGVVNVVKGACVAIPVLFLILNYRPSDQSRNYTAHEHAVNIFRTVESGDTLFVEGDNNSFPLIYGRFVERMKESVILYDRLNLFFRWPTGIQTSKDSWEQTRATMEWKTILGSATERVFYAVFDPASVVKPPSHTIIRYGLLHKSVRKKTLSAPYKVSNLWGYYGAESFYGDFYRDFMNRQVHGQFRLRYAQHLIGSGNLEMGQRVLAEASQIAFDDYAVHLTASMILVNEGCHELAREALEKASLHAVDAAIIHNGWGCYYFKKGDFESAVASFSKAVETGGGKPLYYRNLVLALAKAGREKESIELREKVNEIFPREDGSVEEQGPS